MTSPATVGRPSRHSGNFYFKALGRYVFAYDLGVAASYRLQSGFNVIRQVRARLPQAGSEWVHAHPVHFERSPNVGIFDVRVEKAFHLRGRWGWSPAWSTSLIFNIVKANPVTNYRTNSGSRYREVVAILDPRVVRFGIRYEF